MIILKKIALFSILLTSVLSASSINTIPYSSGYKHYTVRAGEYHLYNFDTLNFNDDVILYMRKDGVYYTDGGSFREVYSVAPNTSTVDLYYKKVNAAETLLGNLEYGITDYKDDFCFFTMTFSEDTSWNLINEIPENKLDTFDSLKSSYSEYDNSTKHCKPIVYCKFNTSIGQIIHPDPNNELYDLPGFNTVFYGKSKISNQNYKFQIYSIDGMDRSDIFSFKFLWAVDSLGNGKFKMDSLVDIRGNGINVVKFFKINYSNNVLKFNRDLKPGFEVNIFMLNGKKIYSHFIKKTSNVLPMSLPTGIYFCSVSNNTKVYRSRFIIR